jgi:dienelactone hydrolase
MNALLPLMVSGLVAAAAPPDPMTCHAFRYRVGEHESQSKKEHEDARRTLSVMGWSTTINSWRDLKGREDWEKFREPRLDALRKSLGHFPELPRDLKVRIRRTLEGAGYRIDNLTFESRPGLVVTANLYRPANPGKAMPGFLIVHSHHAPKTQGELQDMGIMWARAGCLVLVIDQLGHGERRQHPFRTAADYPKPFRPSRQDYYFRYNLAIQLQTIGDSLMGWMVWDIQRGVDLLLSRPGIDSKKIILLGAVAGGGDPAAVAGALDRRIAAVVPFNFGGPQPETRYPLPADVEERFLYTGSGSWESTRNLYRSARDGFLPWVIVGAIAPRKHIYAHEFAWDRDRDPVWKRLQQIHAWYGSKDSLASVHGSGSVRGKPPESTHCTNIGRVHRRGIHEALKRWFGIEAREPDKPERHSATELLCLGKDDQPGTLHELADQIARERLAEARRLREKLKPADRWMRLGKQLLQTLGKPSASDLSFASMFLRPARPQGKRMPLVVAFGQGGPRAFMKHRAAELAWLQEQGSAVLLIDLGGMSNQMPGPGRGRTTAATSLAASKLMVGGTTLESYVHRLFNVIMRQRKHPEIDPDRISLWGESFAAVNPPGARLEVPLDAAQPHLAEPMGPIIALLYALVDPGIHSVRVRGGLVSYHSLLASPFVHVPYDIVVPGVLTVGDLPDVVAALAPRPVRLEGLVDGLNRKVPAKEVERIYQRARAAYRQAKADQKLVIVD